MRVKTYLEDEEFFNLEEGVCGCGIEPQDLEDTDFIYVQISHNGINLGVPACRKCHLLMVSKERLERYRNEGPVDSFGVGRMGFPVLS